jgi:hypothetical protein
MILSSHGIIASQIASFDADAQAFFDRVTTAGGTLSATEQTATNQLVLDMKAAGIWSAMRAVYPMVGASAAACAQNLKSSSFTGTFSSGWTFASTGVTGNGTSAYMDTNFNPSINYNNFNNGYSIYCRTNSSTTRWDFGAYPGFHVYLNYTGVGCRAAIQSSDNNRPSFNDNNSSGFFTFVNNGNNSRKAFRNSILKNTNTTVDNTTRINTTLPLGCLLENNVYQVFSNREYNLLSLHDGLTDTQASNLYTAVQAFQTTLASNV